MRRCVTTLIDLVASVLVVGGALTWGQVAVARFDLVAALLGRSFGEVSGLTAVVYGLVGLAGLHQGLFARWVRDIRIEPTLRCSGDARRYGRASSPASQGVRSVRLR